MNISNTHVNEDLKTYEDNFFNITFSDPPYNLGSKTYIDKDGKFKFKGRAQDFMSKWFFGHEDWEVFFEESFRTLKYGGFCILYGMDRQQPLIQYYAVKAGFEVQQSLYWYFISSFSKSTDVGKMIDKREGKEREVIGRSNRIIAKNPKETNFLGSKTFSETKEGRENSKYITSPATELSKKYDGYKYSICPLKQTVEAIMVFRKPIKNKSVLDDIYAYEGGDKEIHPAIINIDGGRVSMDKPIIYKKGPGGNKNETIKISGGNKENDEKFRGQYYKNDKCRYPSQLFLDEYCADRIDMQSGELKSGSLLQRHTLHESENVAMTGKNYERSPKRDYLSNSGGASRINHIIPWTEEEMDLLYYEPKVSSKERNAGLDKLEDSYLAASNQAKAELKRGNTNYESKSNKKSGYSSVRKLENNHPTLKPLKLNQKIFELFVTPDLDDMKVYVPFAGTFSEVIGILANEVEEENIYACELSEDYIEIGKARLDFWKKHHFDFKNLKVAKTSSKKEKDRGVVNRLW